MPARRFAIAVSFPGEHKRFVRNVVNQLAEELGRDRVFFYEWYEAEFSGADGDLKLREIYREQSDIVVPFFSQHYEKPWCRIEWSATRAMVLQRHREDAVFPVQMDLTSIPGWEEIDIAIRRQEGAKQLKTQKPDAWQAAHRRLYRHLCDTTKEGKQPTREDLQPLYQAVAHGCLAGLHKEVDEEVYYRRITQGEEKYAMRRLGAFGSELGALACFFDEPWSQVSSAFSFRRNSGLVSESGCIPASCGGTAHRGTRTDAARPGPGPTGISRQALATPRF